MTSDTLQRSQAADTRPQPHTVARLVVPLGIAVAALVGGGIGGYLLRGSSAAAPPAHATSLIAGTAASGSSPTPQEVNQPPTTLDWEYCGPVAVCIP